MCLALSTGALALLTWRQHRELQQLIARGNNGTSTPARITVHTATQRSYALPPGRAARNETPFPSAPGDAAQDSRETPGVDGQALVPRAPRRGVSSLMRLMENPEFVRALNLHRNAMLDARFAGLFRQLNLSDEELASFKSLLAEKENVALDVVTVSEMLPDGPLSPDALRESVRGAQAQVERAIQSSLGGERYRVYREYERTLPQRATVAQLEQRLSYTSSPLTPEQSNALVRILAANPPQGAATAAEAPAPATVVVRAGVPEAVPIMPTNAATGRVTEEVVTQAHAVLAPAQVNALREIQAEQEAAIKAVGMIREIIPSLSDTSVWSQLLLQ